jgi:uncharacterized DUF497 family protein
MQFEWDEGKRKKNIQKHGFDFRDAWKVFELPMLAALDDREDYGEDRWIGIGMVETHVVIIVYTERSENTIRIISMMKAVTNERIRYEERLRDELGND